MLNFLQRLTRLVFEYVYMVAMIKVSRLEPFLILFLSEELKFFSVAGDQIFNYFLFGDIF